MKWASSLKMLVNQTTSMELYHQQSERFGLLTILDDQDSSRKVCLKFYISVQK